MAPKRLILFFLLTLCLPAGGWGQRGRARPWKGPGIYAPSGSIGVPARDFGLDRLGEAPVSEFPAALERQAIRGEDVGQWEEREVLVGNLGKVRIRVNPEGRSFYWDGHLHTNFSDGEDTAEEVVRLAFSKWLQALTISDHENLSGIPLAEQVVEKIRKEVGAKFPGMIVIPGVELSVSAPSKKYRRAMHLLGMFIDPKNKLLIRRVNENRRRRMSRMEEQVEKLSKLAVPEPLPITLRQVLKEMPQGEQGTGGDPIVARAIVKLKKGKYAKDTRQAFDRYLEPTLPDGSKNPAYVSLQPISFREGAEAILEAGGGISIAHPFGIPRLGEFLDQYAKDFLTALEALRFSYFRKDARVGWIFAHLIRMAQGKGLTYTPGADYHDGGRKEGAPPGSGNFLRGMGILAEVGLLDRFYDLSREKLKAGAFRTGQPQVFSP
ncbi:MAG: hypothetical protein HY402_07135 [Elusimicrobia bacterium]|nr:hypothetical protein [Elusimicrobiota bacterium]